METSNIKNITDTVFNRKNIHRRQQCASEKTAFKRRVLTSPLNRFGRKDHLGRQGNTSGIWNASCFVFFTSQFQNQKIEDILFSFPKSWKWYQLRTHQRRAKQEHVSFCISANIFMKAKSFIDTVSTAKPFVLADLL